MNKRRALETQATKKKHGKHRLLLNLSLVLVGIVSSIVLSSCGEGSGPYLYVMNVDGSGNPVKLGVIGTNPSWSPEGATIAFWRQATKHGEESEIRVVNADGTGERSLTRNMTASGYPAPWGRPAWSRDGKRIAFHSAQGYSASAYIVINADGSEPKQVERLAEAYLGFGISPDGRSQIVQNSHQYSPGNWYRDFYIRRIDGAGQVFIGRNIEGVGWSDIFWFHAKWFPDGTRITLTYNRPPSSDIYVVNANGSDSMKLGEGREPAVSPDGSKIAFELRGDIWVMNSDGSNRFQLTNSRDAEYDPAWSPDSRKIVFVVSRETLLKDPL